MDGENRRCHMCSCGANEDDDDNGGGKEKTKGMKFFAELTISHRFLFPLFFQEKVKELVCTF